MTDVIIGMPLHIIMTGAPMAIMAIMASQRSFMRGIIDASVGIIFIIMPSFVISQDIVHVMGAMPPPIIIGIIMPMPFIMGAMPPPIIIGIIMPMPFIMGIMGIMPPPIIMGFIWPIGPIGPIWPIGMLIIEPFIIGIDAFMGAFMGAFIGMAIGIDIGIGIAFIFASSICSAG